MRLLPIGLFMYHMKRSHPSATKSQSQHRVVVALYFVLCLVFLPGSTSYDTDVQGYSALLDAFESDITSFLMADSENMEDLVYTTALDSTRSSVREALDGSLLESSASVNTQGLVEDCATKERVAKLTTLKNNAATTTVSDADLVCYYTSEAFNMKGMRGKELGDAALCKGGWSLGAGKMYHEPQMANAHVLAISSRINAFRAQGAGKIEDIAASRSFETAVRAPKSQAVVLLLVDKSKGCAYPVAHIPLGHTNRRHTEDELTRIEYRNDANKAIKLFSKAAIQDIAKALYKGIVLPTGNDEKNLSIVLYSLFAPCTDCSGKLLTAFAAQEFDIGSKVIIFNREKTVYGGNYKQQHLDAIAASDSDTSNLAIYHVDADRGVNDSGNLNPLSKAVALQHEMANVVKQAKVALEQAKAAVTDTKIKFKADANSENAHNAANNIIKTITGLKKQVDSSASEKFKVLVKQRADAIEAHFATVVADYDAARKLLKSIPADKPKNASGGNAKPAIVGKIAKR